MFSHWERGELTPLGGECHVPSIVRMFDDRSAASRPNTEIRSFFTFPLLPSSSPPLLLLLIETSSSFKAK